MLTFRSALYNVAFYLNLLLWIVVAIPTLFLPRRFFMGVARYWGLSSVRLLKLIAGTDVHWSGLERLPKGGCLIAAKHQSTWETFALFTVLKDPAFVLKRELMFIPFFGWYLIKGAMLPVRRGQTGRDLLDFSEPARQRGNRGGAPAHHLSRGHTASGRRASRLQIGRRPSLRRDGCGLRAHRPEFRGLLVEAGADAQARNHQGRDPRPHRARHASQGLPRRASVADRRSLDASLR